MGWQGEKLKSLSKQKGIPIMRIAQLVGVSRQSVGEWIGGQTPKGNHLVSLCKVLEVSPDLFFEDESGKNVSMPVHRVRKRAKINPDVQKEALELAFEYSTLFKNQPYTEIVPVIRTADRSEKSAIQIASYFRKFSGIDQDKPLKYEHAFQLLDKLGIVTIFRYFPVKIKTYAFYIKIFNHRVVFVNSHTNILDLIFPLIHEAVHAVRDEVYSNGSYEKEEEDFCDMVANHTQFPGNYANLVYETIKLIPDGNKINVLKSFGETNSHSLFGILKMIQTLHSNFKLSVGGADTNLKRQFVSVGEIINQQENPSDFLELMNTLSPRFLQILAGQIDNLSDRRLAELIGMDNILDANQLRKFLSKYHT